MKLQRATWILFAVALTLGGLVYFYEIKGKPQREAIQAEQEKIFSLKIEDIKSLTVKTQQDTIQFERTEDENQPWQMKQPEDVPANDAVLSFLLNLLAEGERDRTLTVPPERAADYGLDTPLARIDFQVVDGKKHRLVLGRPDFSERFIYAQIDPEGQDKNALNIVLVPKDFQYAVERDLDEWKKNGEAN